MRSLISPICIAAFASTLIAAFPAMAQAPSLPMKPGVWEIVVSGETPGVDKKTATTSRICFKADALRATEQVLPQQGQYGARCAVKDFKYATDTATWTATCNSKTGALTGSGTVTFKANEYSGSAQLTGKEGTKTIKVNQTFAAKRISDCP